MPLLTWLCLLNHVSLCVVLCPVSVLALGADAVIDDSDAALADIESFLNNLDTM